MVYWIKPGGKDNIYSNPSTVFDMVKMYKMDLYLLKSSQDSNSHEP